MQLPVQLRLDYFVDKSNPRMCSINRRVLHWLCNQPLPKAKSSPSPCGHISLLPSAAFHKLVGFSEKPVEYASGVRLGGDGLRRRTEAAVRIVSFVQSLLVLLVRLRHRGQLQRAQGGESTYEVSRDVVLGNRNVDLASRVRIGQLRREPSRELQGRLVLCPH